MPEPRLTAAQKKTLRYTMSKSGGRAGGWFPYGSGEWATAKRLSDMGLAYPGRGLRGYMVLTNEGRAIGSRLAAEATTGGADMSDLESDCIGRDAAPVIPVGSEDDTRTIPLPTCSRCHGTGTERQGIGHEWVIPAADTLTEASVALVSALASIGVTLTDHTPEMIAHKVLAAASIPVITNLRAFMADKRPREYDFELTDFAKGACFALDQVDEWLDEHTTKAPSVFQHEPCGNCKTPGMCADYAYCALRREAKVPSGGER